MDSKVCRGCGVDKPIGEFNKRARSKDGYRPTCRACDHLVRNGQDMPLAGRPSTPAPASEAPPVQPEKVIGRIGPEPAPGESPRSGPRIVEVRDEDEEIEKAKAEEFSRLLDKGLSIRQRARLYIKIAKNVGGPNAAIALKALQDINVATKVVSRSGQRLDLGSLFVLPPGSDVKMTG